MAVINIMKDGRIVDDMSEVTVPAQIVVNVEAMMKAEQSTINYLRKVARNEKKKNQKYNYQG